MLQLQAGLITKIPHKPITSCCPWVKMWTPRPVGGLRQSMKVEREEKKLAMTMAWHLIWTQSSVSPSPTCSFHFTISPRSPSPHDSHCGVTFQQTPPSTQSIKTSQSTPQPSILHSAVKLLSHCYELQSCKINRSNGIESVRFKRIKSLILCLCVCWRMDDSW